MDKMTEQEPHNHDRLPDAIAAQAARERTVRSHFAALHPWWSRRELVLARVATYLAVTQDQVSDEFLSGLAEVNPPNNIVTDARHRLRDTAWQWEWQKAVRFTPDADLQAPSKPPSLKVLDPFAGGGSIPHEAARLGCESYAGDLSPLAHLILRCSLEFPAKLISASNEAGSSADGKWAGLVDELEHWMAKVQDSAASQLDALFPASANHGSTPDSYLFFYIGSCPQCGDNLPIHDVLQLRARQTPLALQLERHEHKFVPVLVEGKPKRMARTVSCPKCGAESAPNDIFGKNPREILAALKIGRDYQVVSDDDAPILTPWLTAQEDRLKELLSQPFAQALGSPLPDLSYKSVQRYGLESFLDLFSKRQLLAALEYVVAVKDAIRLAREQLTPLAASAISSYLALFIGQVVSRNSRLCRWNYNQELETSSFEFPGARFPRVLIERNPADLARRWLDQVKRVITEVSTVPSAQKTYVGSAAKLPFEDEFFDAVVTDPPYYDSVPYSELADFFWVWQAGVISNEEAARYAQSPALEEVAGRTASAEEAYESLLLDSLREIKRVLKPGRRLCLFVTGKASESSQNYIDLAERVGFELQDIRSLHYEALRSSSLASTVERHTYLLYFRKPISDSVWRTLETKDATQLLEAAEAGRPLLLSGLAQLVSERVNEKDLDELLPAGLRGTKVERVMETLAEEDPRNFLEQCFGKKGVRDLAREVASYAEGDGRSPIDCLLSHYGFTIPAVADDWPGPTQVLDSLRRATVTVQRATSKTDVWGPFLEGSSSVERLLRVGIWAWMQLAFGEQRDEKLLELLKASDPTKDYDLDLLSFGHIATLFRGLPEVLAKAPLGEMIEQKLGRRHVYRPKKLNKLLDKLVAWRNRVEHNKEDYRDKTPFASVVDDISSALTAAQDLVHELARNRVVPQVVEPVEEIRDKFGRKSYTLCLDDGTEQKSTFTTALELGVPYLYFGSLTNPRPVDPINLPVAAVEDVP